MDGITMIQYPKIKPSQYITYTKVNSAIYPSGVGKSSTILAHLAKVKVHVHLCRVASKTR